MNIALGPRIFGYYKADQQYAVPAGYYWMYRIEPTASGAPRFCLIDPPSGWSTQGNLTLPDGETMDFALGFFVPAYEVDLCEPAPIPAARDVLEAWLAE